MEQFSCSTKIVSGAGAVTSLKTLGIHRLLLVTDPFFVKNGTAKRVAAITGAEATELFDKIQPDPSVALVAEGTALVRTFAPDTIVALGGGSTMDCAKAMAYFSGMTIRLIAIPTTSGSGSEVTDFSVLTHAQGKYPLVDPRLRPEIAVLDDDLLTELPKSLIADAGFDVICHALEAYVARNAGMITDALAQDAFCVTFAALPLSYRGDISVRGRIHLAATMAGVAFSQAGLGLCHGLAHSLGGQFHVPHGRLNAILLPAVISCNAHAVGNKYARIARSAGITGAADSVAVRNLKNALIRLRRELDLPETLAQAGIDSREVWYKAKAIVKTTLEDPCCRTNPLPVEDFMVRRILEEVTGHV